MFVNTMPSDVTWFSSSQVGAPQMMGDSNGDMLKVLDACLVTGFGEKTAQSVAIDGNTVVLNFGAGHNYLPNQRLLVSGASDALINGNHRIVSTTNNTVTLSIIGAINAGGVVVTKIAPLGWESIFGKTDSLKRAYRSLSPSSAKKVLYLDMSYPSAAGYHATSPAKRASVSVCQDMQLLGEQIGSLTDATNNFTINPNGSLLWYQKRDATYSSYASNAVSQWTIVGNSEFFYFIVGWSSVAVVDAKPVCDVFGFGEYIGFYDDPSDKTFLMALYNVNDAQSAQVGELGAQVWSDGINQSISAYILDAGSLVNKKISIVGGVKTNTFTSGYNSIGYPNANGNTLFTMPMRIGASDAPQIHGMLPAIAFVENKIEGSVYNGNIVDDLLLTSVAKTKSNNANYGYYAFYVGE